MSGITVASPYLLTSFGFLLIGTFILSGGVSVAYQPSISEFQARRIANLARTLSAADYRPVPTLSPRTLYYRCDDCGFTASYSAAPGPLTSKPPCRQCGSPFCSPVSPYEADQLIPDDICGGNGREVPGYGFFPTCHNCKYEQFWLSNPCRTCKLGLPQHTHINAANNRITRPFSSICADSYYKRFPRPDCSKGAVC